MHYDVDIALWEQWYLETRDGVSSDYLEVDAIETEAGNDTILLGERAVQIDAGAGNDTLTASTDATAFLRGGAGDDLIDLRGAGEDSKTAVVGGDGTDVFYGSTGADEMRVIWSDSETMVETATVITDFDPSEDSLRISVDQAVFSGDVTPVLSEVDGNTEVIVQGERVAILQGTTGLS